MFTLNQSVGHDDEAPLGTKPTPVEELMLSVVYTTHLLSFMRFIGTLHIPVN